MEINRKMQNSILQHLTHHYPAEPSNDFYNELIQTYGKSEAVGNILYLEMHDLLSCNKALYIGTDIPDILWQTAQPTQKAFDFLADDGGLSAILGVVTVKLHSDTIQDLLTAKIEQADNITPTEKSRLKSLVGKMGDAALAKFTEKAIDAVTSPQIISLLQNL
ncbi:hypothetical protein [Bergeriella denitrificans]|uniref:Uncharacterized protein n=1 Tax=Bergeriella denitrificans TaxID=494 RepID=A0A378UDV8_BERDE|nr:hypothetical protein [Bergeriella denitrificans]STZ75556.1 Uncharacterised protein [Bergeriella denitrificans]